MFKTDEKTRNYFYFSAARRNAQQKPRKLNMQTRLVIDFGGQIEKFPFLYYIQRPTFQKTTENKSKRLKQIQFENNE